jgi:hypothetical protein
VYIFTFRGGGGLSVLLPALSDPLPNWDCEKGTVYMVNGT